MTKRKLSRLQRRVRAVYLAFLAAGLIALVVTASAKGDDPFGPPPPSWYLVKSVHLNLRGSPQTATFTVRVPKPRKIILYPEAMRVSSSVVCLKGATVSHLSRSYTTMGTRNLLWHVPGSRFDACYVTIAAAQGAGAGYVSVQAMQRP